MPSPTLPRMFFIDRLESPIGTMLLIHDPEERLRALEFHDFEARMRDLLRLHYGKDGVDFVVKSRTAPSAIRQALTGYFAGDLTAIDAVSVATAGTSFQREVWTALRKIRPGTTLSYGGLARELGRPKSFRAVGLANGANPVAIVVPCHHRRRCQPCRRRRRNRPQTLAADTRRRRFRKTSGETDFEGRLKVGKSMLAGAGNAPS
jgi:methylated-DNA-[protein]-cysteine S-methyltransferase